MPYQLRTKNPAGAKTITNAMELAEALRLARQLRDSGHKEILLLNLMTGAEVSTDYAVKEPKSDA